MEKKILDVTCGSRSIWFDKNNPYAVYCDKRREEFRWLWKNSDCTLTIDPDVICDFTDLPFSDNSFPLVVFDPPHCPVNGCNAEYRGSTCSARRAKSGIYKDPKTNADGIREMEDEQLAHFLRALVEGPKLEVPYLEWLRSGIM